MPRVKIFPVDPQRISLSSGRNNLSRRPTSEHIDSGSTDEAETAHGLNRQSTQRHVLANGSLTPTSYLEALMQAAPGQDPLQSSEELIDLAEAIQAAMGKLLTEREQFVVEAIVFEGLSLREVAARWNNAWSKTQVARIRDSAFKKLATSTELRELAGVSVPLT